MKRIVTVLHSHFFLFLSAGLLALLLFKNPFSERTLIPNFEPFPDTFYYISPARCLVKGRGFYMCLEHFAGKDTELPPLYSMLLVPFFVINNDPRMFYFLNLTLSFSSLVLLYAILKKVTEEQFIHGFVLLAYVTSYAVYWYPTLAMTENILIPIFFLAIWLLLQPITYKKLFLAGLTAAGFYGSKYAAVGATGIYGLLYLIKIVRQRLPISQRVKQMLLFVFIVGSSFMLLGGWRLAGTLTMLITQSQQAAEPVIQTTTTTQAETMTWLDTRFVMQNLTFYGNALLGKPTRILWDVRPLYPMWVAILGLVGLAVGFIRKKYRRLTIALVLLLVGQLIAALPFYANDSRYALFMLPIILIGAGMTLATITEKITPTGRKKIIQTVLLSSLIIFYLVPKVQTMRQQIVLNLKYAEQPWWYLSTQQFNQFFSTLSTDKKPYFITLHSPFYLDYFGNDTYQPLPLSRWQDFRGGSAKIWGIPGQQDLPSIYTEKLIAGEKVYATNYGTSASGSFTAEFEQLKTDFDLESVYTGCYNLCNIYQVSLRSE